MARKWHLLLFVCYALCSTAGHCADHSDRYYGVNLSNPQWISDLEREALVEQLSSLGVKAVRFPIRHNTEAELKTSLSFAQKLNDKGIWIVANIYPAYESPGGVRPGVTGTVYSWDQRGLSKIDILKTKSVLRSVFAELDRRNISLAAVEFDNEINWTPFNGDFKVPSCGRTLTYQDLKMPAFSHLRHGLSRYVQALRIVREVLSASMMNVRTPLITAGLVQTSEAWPTAEARADAVDTSDFIKLMKEEGVDAIVDGIGLHIYDFSIGSNLDELIRNACSDARPCWITEWGVSNPSPCRNQDAKSSKEVVEIASKFYELAQKKIIVAAYYYNWSGSNSDYNIFACGLLTSSGSAILSMQRSWSAVGGR